MLGLSCVPHGKNHGIIEDFAEKSYNNNGKPWKSSRILRMKPIFHSSSVFFSFLHFFHFSFSGAQNLFFFFWPQLLRYTFEASFPLFFGFAVRTPWQCSRWARGARIFLYFFMFLLFFFIFLDVSSFFFIFLHLVQT